MERARLGRHPQRVIPDRSGLRMANTTAIESARLLIDAATFHIDPTFFLHHEVCFVQSFNEKGANVFMAQMINKLWYDQQHRDPSNKNALGGGSVSWKVNTSLPFTLYPTGGPPLLNVRTNSSIHA